MSQTGSDGGSVSAPATSSSIAPEKAGEPAEGGPGPDAGQSFDLQRQIGWSLASLGVLTISIGLESNTAFSPTIRALASLLALVALVSIALPWFLRGAAANVHQHIVLGLWALVTVLGVDAALRGAGGVTDELAIDQRAGELVIKGIDPYAHALFGASTAIPVAPGVQTSLIGGGVVSHLSYPSLAALADVPALLLGFGPLSGSVTDTVGLLATVVLMYLVLPVRYRWAAVLIGTMPALTSLANGGSTDFIYIPFLILAAWHWDRFADPEEHGAARWIGPIAMGIAMSIKQTPWLFLPFILIGLVAEARARGLKNHFALALRYLGYAAATFFVLNVVFFLWGPSAYVEGLLQPFSPNIYPEGFGLVALDTFGPSGGVYGYLSYASFAALLAVIALSVARYPELKRAMLFLIPVALFAATRSLAGYMFFTFPAALVAAATVRPATAPFPRREARPAAILAGVAAFLLVVFVALAALTGPPLRLTVRGSSASAKLHTIYRIELEVANTTGESLSPSYATFNGEQIPISEEWLVSGPGSIPAHSERLVTLTAPSLTAMPMSGTHWRVAAFTRPPAAISYSPAHGGQRLQMTMSPNVIRREVASGEPITLTVQVRGAYALPEERAGRKVRLESSELASGSRAAQVSIDGGKPGHASVQQTDSSGKAKFTVQSEGAGIVVLHAGLSESTAYGSGSASLLVRFK